MLQIKIKNQYFKIVQKGKLKSPQIKIKNNNFKIVQKVK